MRALVRLVTALLGLVLAVAGALLVIEIAWALLRPGPGFLLVPWPAIRAKLDTLSWNDSPVRATAVIAGVVAALLLLAAARAGHRVVRLHDPAPEVTVVTTPKSLARLVGHRIREQDEVASASVVAGRKRIRVRATSEFTQAGDLGTRLTEATNEVVEDLPLPRTPKVSVSVRPSKER